MFKMLSLAKWCLPYTGLCVEEHHVFVATSPFKEEDEEEPMFVGDITIVAKKSGKLVGMFAKDLVVDFEKLRLCTRSLCMPLYTNR